MDVDVGPFNPVFPPTAHPFAQSPSGFRDALAGPLIPPPAFGPPAFPASSSFQWPATPWSSQPSPNPFATQQPGTTPEWLAALPPLMSLLQSAPWLLAQGFGTFTPAPGLGTFATAPTPQPGPSQASLPDRPSGERLSASTTPSAPSHTGSGTPPTATRPTATPPTAPRAMRAPVPRQARERPSLHSRIAGAPPARTLEERLADPTPPRAAASAAPKRPASSLLERLVGDGTKRVRLAPLSPPSDPTPAASSTATAGGSIDPGVEGADRKRGKRGGGAGNRRRRRRKARRLAQEAEDREEERRGEGEDEDDGDADSFVHRPFSPDSGAAM
ncbi:hypothetical protein GGF50DRAFT_67544 [Schizophyllum commune]